MQSEKGGIHIMSENRELLADIDEEILCIDDFDDAIIGYVTIAHHVIALYDRLAIINILVTRDQMDIREAEEYFDYNIAGSYVGEYTPAIATFFEKVNNEKYICRLCKEETK